MSKVGFSRQSVNEPTDLDDLPWVLQSRVTVCQYDKLTAQVSNLTHAGSGLTAGHLHQHKHSRFTT
jgi:hypothetical protein